ncbi:MAG: MarR family winged helix-turn-helix transcriptional regulator [Paracoccaceae bacterium]
MTEEAAAIARGETGVHGAQALALLVLRRIGPCRLVQLGAAVGTARAATTTLAARLEKAGLAERCPDRDDARAQRIALTPLGAERAEAVEALIARFDAALLDGFSADEGRVILRFLETVGGRGSLGRKVDES